MSNKLLPYHLPYHTIKIIMLSLIKFGLSEYAGKTLFWVF